MKLVTNLEGHNLNLLHVTRVFIEGRPDFSKLPNHRNYYERKYWNYDNDYASIPIRHSLGQSTTYKIVGGKTFTDRDKDHEWFYAAPSRTRWWEGRTRYKNFRWVTEQELEQMHVWVVCIRL